MTSLPGWYVTSPMWSANPLYSFPLAIIFHDFYWVCLCTTRRCMYTIYIVYSNYIVSNNSVVRDNDIAIITILCCVV